MQLYELFFPLGAATGSEPVTQPPGSVQGSEPPEQPTPSTDTSELCIHAYVVAMVTSLFSITTE